MARQSITGLSPDLKLVQLRALLTAIGANTGGTKPLLVSRLQQELHPPRSGIWPKRELPTRTRILSLDMGIKNLAFCVCDVDGQTTNAVTKRKSKEDKPRIRAQRGKAETTRTQSSRSATQTIDEPHSPLRLTVQAWKRVSLIDLALPPDYPMSKSDPRASEVAEPYHPRELSGMAYSLVQDVLLPYQPSIILIERQRFRSNSAAAIQEWTVRVNMLESMLWAVLRTLGSRQRASSSSNSPKKRGNDLGFPDVRDVNPSRVGAFWIHRDAESPTRKIDKKDRINFLRSWIAEPARSIELEFAPETQQLRDAFASGTTGQKGKRAHAKADVVDVPTAKATEPQEEKVGKLDDLADCLLQAAAWVQWEANRRLISETSVEDVDDIENLLSMVQR